MSCMCVQSKSQNKMNYNNPKTSIENGYFIFTLMPSLRCSLNCPHCYLSKEQRNDKTILPVNKLAEICNKIKTYYKSIRCFSNIRIINYWYGGEPTEMGLIYTQEAVNTINSIFTKEDGFDSSHIFLTSLVTVNESEWYPFFKMFGRNYIQTSFDGLMRGKGYLKKWETKVKNAISYGLKVATISVVNQKLINTPAKELLFYLTELGVREVSFLPFMLNMQNDGEKYDSYSVDMDVYSEYLIEITKAYFELVERGYHPPEIGQYRFIVEQYKNVELSNISAQTLFLLPNGDMCLPDYIDGNKEYLNIFGNILESSFEEILTSSNRRKYLRKQIRRNNNTECEECEYSGHCIMEFWKENCESKDCYGASNYVNYVLKDTHFTESLNYTSELS